MTAFTYAELFAGAGGLSMGLEMAGFHPFAHAEIEPHARAVLRKHWPDCRLDGDVSQVDGREYRGITLLSGGSPCQDLSIAGKRAGMSEGSGTRSSLYFEQVRIWQESEAPYFLWENVLGALSSNNGRDFAAVLSALVGAAVPVPDAGWRGAGVASGPAGVAAWRVLDCQFFGPPQRRRRVFVLGARAGGVDPAEVLSLGESLSGHPSARRESGEGVAADSGDGVAVAFQPGNLMRRAGQEPSESVFPTLGAATLGDQSPHVLTYDTRGNGDGRVVNTMAGDHQNRVTDYTAVVLRNREGKPGGGKGPLLSAERQGTLGTANDQVVFAKPQVVHPTLMTDHFGKHAGCNQHVTELAQILPAIGVPRRLTPVECERLMGWPDGHTALGVDERGREYALSDTARYKLCGNGVASPVAGWIAWRLKEALDTPRPA